MKELDQHELNCLKKLASAHSDVIPPCAHDILHHLESLGLVEQTPGIALPLEMKRASWQVTQAGHEALRGTAR